MWTSSSGSDAIGIFISSPRARRELPSAACCATARANSVIMQASITLKAMLHGKQDSTGIYRRQRQVDLGFPVAFSRAAGESGCRADRSLHDASPESAEEARKAFGAKLAFTDFRALMLLRRDRRDYRVRAGAIPLRDDQGRDRSRQACLHRVAARPYHCRSRRTDGAGPREGRADGGWPAIARKSFAAVHEGADRNRLSWARCCPVTPTACATARWRVPPPARGSAT